MPWGAEAGLPETVTKGGRVLQQHGADTPQKLWAPTRTN